MTLRSFFEPEGIVLVGATDDPGKLGYGVAQNLSTFPGEVYFVGTEPGELFGKPVRTRIEDVPDPVDMAVVLVPASAVPGVVESCGRRGIGSVIVVSGGFRETGSDGAVLEEACVEAARRYGISLIGPNCIGIIDTHTSLDTTFLRPSGAPEGEIGFLSHSGALCAAVIDWARIEGFGFSRIVSLGNQADLTETDLLPVVAADPGTKVITMYLEGIGDGQGFLQAAAASEKPVVVHKAGRFAAGRRAAASHTGALAGNEAAFEAAFRRAGVLRATSSREMFDWARALAVLPAMQGPNVAIVTNAGGPGVIAADAIEASGLTLAQLSGVTTRALRGLLPDAAGVDNPVDMLASATPEQYARSLDLVLADDGVDAAMVILPPPPRSRAEVVIEALGKPAKPVVVALMGGPAVEVACERVRAAHLPSYRFPTEAAGALGALYRRSTFHRHTPCDAPVGGVVGAVTGEGWLSQEAALRVVRDAGVRTVPSIEAATEVEAVEAAAAFGFPVVMKVEASGVLHKSSAGGVFLGLNDRTGVSGAYRQLRERHDGMRGVVVQPMLDVDREFVVGVVRDPQFGPLLMFGTGGVDVERAGDVAFALAPVSCEDVEYLFAETRAGRMMPRAVVAPVREALLRLGKLALDHPEILEAEINPLAPTSTGVVALDARVRVGSLS